jgi:hypothetical protein
MSRGNLHAQNNEVDAGERWEDKARVREEQEESFTGEERIRGWCILPSLTKKNLWCSLALFFN